MHCPKKWKGCVHQGMSEQEEREGVKRGGQEDVPTGDGRMRQRDSEGTRGSNVLCKKGLEELLHAEQTSCTLHDGQMHACGGWAMGSEEGGRRREEKKKGEAGRTDPFGRASGA